MKRLLSLVSLAALTAGCSGEIVDPAEGGPDSPTAVGGSTATPPGTPGAGTGSGSSVVPGGGGGAGSAGSGSGVPGTPTTPGGGAPSTSTQPGTDPGRVTLRRLNRAEYNNTVRDLLGTDLQPANEFTIDDRGGGFDNIADVLSLSPLHLSNYHTAAVTLVDAAFANATQRARLVTCNLAQQGATCAKSTLASFMPRAFRRPVTEAEVNHFMTPVTTATTQGDTAEQGLKLALQAVLLSTNFLFRVELDPDPTSLAPHPLSGHEVASRLSYFLWSSMPDDELFAAATAGALADPANVQAQAKRMMASPKAKALVDNFAGQWLYTRAIDELVPDPTTFPGFDAELRAAMKAETSLLFEEVALKGLPANQLLTAEFTFANDRLAQHYGLPAPGSKTPVRVSLAGSTQRRGFLSHAGVLTATSYPTRTSPVLRGHWILQELLCTQVPPPPPGVIAGLPEKPADPNATLREQLNQHRTDPTCNSCHQLMDPLGFGLENFNAIGAYRTMEGTKPVDSSGALPDGRTFDGPIQLATLIAADPHFATCMVDKLYTYALGRGPDRSSPGHMDPHTIEVLATRLRTNGFSFQDLIAGLVSSAPYLTRRGEPPL
ncbi:MAG TPA: DUF1592 domain-containing protein [Polyangiaceae bacterium]|nr:DUF1592 domain-containing protein [Polyangiaceae bacterium]